MTFEMSWKIVAARSMNWTDVYEYIGIFCSFLRPSKFSPVRSYRGWSNDCLRSAYKFVKNSISLWEIVRIQKRIQKESLKMSTYV